VRFLIKVSGQRLILPFYHAVTDEPMPHISNLYPVKSIDQFERDLDFFLKYYQPIDLKRLFALVQNNEHPQKPSFHLSFDDGLRQCSDVIADILLRKGIPATFFVNTAFIDNKDLFFRYKASLIIERAKESGKNWRQKKDDLLQINYRDREKLDLIGPTYGLDFKAFLAEYRPYMTVEQIKALAEKGFTIGSHSIDHPRFSELTVDEQTGQVEKSLAELKNILHFQVNTFSFPFTDDGVRLELFQNLQKINPAVDLTFGCAGMKNDSAKINLQRIPVEKGNVPASAYIKSEYLYFMMRAFLNKNTIQRPV
jgi:peptidoglycan/xylan/chitin deacetylase (PgdA/CDA1 family)